MNDPYTDNQSSRDMDYSDLLDGAETKRRYDDCKDLIRQARQDERERARRRTKGEGGIAMPWWAWALVMIGVAMVLSGFGDSGQGPPPGDYD